MLALGLNGEALKDFREAVRLDSSFAATWWNMAYLLHEEKKYEEAEIAVAKATELAPKDAQAWLLKGRIAFNQRHYEAAIKAYDRCLALNRNFAEAYLNRGEAKRVLGDEAAACKDWKKVLKLDQGPLAEKAEQWVAIVCE